MRGQFGVDLPGSSKRREDVDAPGGDTKFKILESWSRLLCKKLGVPDFKMFLSRVLACLPLLLVLSSSFRRRLKS